MDKIGNIDKCEMVQSLIQTSEWRKTNANIEYSIPVFGTWLFQYPFRWPQLNVDWRTFAPNNRYFVAGVSHLALVMLKWLFHFIHKQADERLVKESA